MSKRKSISQSLRYDVFKRDNFTCQYCGKAAPDVILEVDHINPVANGGDNNILNLITACKECNRGKGKKLLSENERLKKQVDQLKELNEKREQLTMLVKWRNELLNFENEQVDNLEDIIRKSTGFIFTDEYRSEGREILKKVIQKYGANEALESTTISISQYFDGTEESVNKVINYIERICYNRSKGYKNYNINYLCKIIENNFGYKNFEIRHILDKHFQEKDFEPLKEKFINEDIDIEELIEEVKAFYHISKEE